MIIGEVNNYREAVISFAVMGEEKTLQSVQAVIDTGYTGFLTLPAALIKQLNLTWYMQQEGVLGDGSICLFDVYEASVIWDGQIIPVEVNESEADPLVGMGLLEGFELKIQGIANGAVTITALV